MPLIRLWKSTHLNRIILYIWMVNVEVILPLSPKSAKYLRVESGARAYDQSVALRLHHWVYCHIIYYVHISECRVKRNSSTWPTHSSLICNTKKNVQHFLLWGDNVVITPTIHRGFIEGGLNVQCTTQGLLGVSEVVPGHTSAHRCYYELTLVSRRLVNNAHWAFKC